MANTRPNKNIPSEQENPLFHDTWKLLKNYRDAVWNLELAVQQVRSTFEIEFGSSIEEFLDSIYLAGADIGGTRLEDYARSIERSNKMLTLLNSAVDILHSKHKHGEQYYWRLYYSYLSPQQLQNTDEIIESLRPHIANISHRTYYRRRPEAVQALSSILWGYLNRLIMRRLVASGKDCTGVDALYDLLEHLYLQPAPNSILVKAVSFFKLLLGRKFPFRKALAVFHSERLEPMEKQVMALLRHQMLSTAELIGCTENGKRRLKNNDELMECLYHDETTDCDSIVTDCRVSETRFPVLTAVANLYFKQQITFQIL